MPFTIFQEITINTENIAFIRGNFQTKDKYEKISYPVEIVFSSGVSYHFHSSTKEQQAALLKEINQRLNQ